MSATTITDVYYLVRRQTGSAETATESVIQLLALMEICGVDRRVVEQAIALGFDDFEDAIQVACAIALGLEVIVTRDVAGFTASPILALLPQELRNQLIEQGG